MPPYPQWLHCLAWAWLALCFACSLIIIFDELHRPQKMMIMNLVWPITALYFGPVALWGYLHSGVKSTRRGITRACGRKFAQNCARNARPRFALSGRRPDSNRLPASR